MGFRHVTGACVKTPDFSRKEITMKECKKCKQSLELSAFSKDKRQKDGLFYYCKECCKKKDKQRYSKNQHELCEKSKEAYHKTKDKVKNRNLSKTYGIDLDTYNQMRIEQNYACLICKTHENDLTRGLFVDHCHETGKVRGLLCHHCNFLLGNAKDSVLILQEAIKYLTRME